MSAIVIIAVVALIIIGVFGFFISKMGFFARKKPKGDVAAAPAVANPATTTEAPPALGSVNQPPAPVAPTTPPVPASPEEVITPPANFDAASVNTNVVYPQTPAPAAPPAEPASAPVEPPTAPPPGPPTPPPAA